MFVDLVQLGEGTQDIKRRIPFERFRGAHGEHAMAVRDVLRRLQDHRLITTSDDGRLYEVVHEALIREWPRLRQWIDKDRADLRLQRELAEAARQWEERKKDASFLFQGTRLSMVREWAETHDSELTPWERASFRASIDKQEQEKAEEESRRQKLEEQRKLAERKAEETSSLLWATRGATERKCNISYSPCLSSQSPRIPSGICSTSVG